LLILSLQIAGQHLQVLRPPIDWSRAGEVEAGCLQHQLGHGDGGRSRLRPFDFKPGLLPQLDFAGDRCFLPPMCTLIDRPFWLDQTDPYRFRSAMQDLLSFQPEHGVTDQRPLPPPPPLPLPLLPPLPPFPPPLPLLPRPPLPLLPFPFPSSASSALVPGLLALLDTKLVEGRPTAVIPKLVLRATAGLRAISERCVTDARVSASRSAAASRALLDAELVEGPLVDVVPAIVLRAGVWFGAISERCVTDARVSASRSAAASRSNPARLSVPPVPGAALPPLLALAVSVLALPVPPFPVALLPVSAPALAVPPLRSVLVSLLSALIPLVSVLVLPVPALATLAPAPWPLRSPLPPRSAPAGPPL
jgi:hypothetical protein